MIDFFLRILTIVAASALALTTIIFFASLGIILMQVFGFLPLLA